MRVENAVGPGTPDINYDAGWIESKRLKRWPVRIDTVVRVPHYVPEQRAWHVKRHTAGGLVHVVIQIGTAILVFNAFEAAQGLGFWTRREMFARAKFISDPWDAERFRRFIDEVVRDHRGKN